MQAVDAIFDVGKTHIKLSLYSIDSQQEIAEQRRENQSVQTDDYLAFDTDSIWQWLLQQLSNYSQDYQIDRLSICTHGATCALVDDVDLVFPIPDYEDTRFEEISDQYPRPKFDETFSPNLPAGLNLGRSIYWLCSKYPNQFSQTQQILMYPQYWGWKLTGRAVSEVTSLGCHTDLWNPVSKDFSSLVKSMGWTRLFPEQLSAGDFLGTLKPELVEQWNLNPALKVFNGIHDSNASLVPYLKAVDKPATVISSGTWFIIANLVDKIDPSRIDADKDMLLNTSFENKPVPSIRFMGGREWETINRSKNNGATMVEVKRLIDHEVFALPSFSDTGGPFNGNSGRIVSDIELSDLETSALATLYVALMTDYCLDQFSETGDIFIEGPVSQNPMFINVLCHLRQNVGCHFSQESTGTSAGLLALMDEGEGSTLNLETFSGTDCDQDALLLYRDQWRALVCPFDGHC